MASLPINFSTFEWNLLSSGPTIQPMGYLITAFVVFLAAYIIRPINPNPKDLPFLNPPKSWLGLKEKRSFYTLSTELLEKGRSRYPDRPYRIFTDIGEIVMLPAKYAHDIRNNPNLSFGRAVHKEFNGDIPGFDVFKIGGSSDQLLQVVARKELTKSLARATDPLTREAALAMSINFGESQDWHEISVKPAALDVVARMASRIFLGLPLCRDDAWLHLTKEITVNVFLGATMINIFPPPLRRFVHWFQPHCRKVRQQTVEGRRLIKKVTQDRQNLKDAARAAGQSPPEFHDALEWAEQEAAAKGIKYDPAQFQFALSSAAMHTTTDLLTQCILELAHHPEIIAPLREEISRVLKTEGWKKSALYNMKLLDSVIKESLRMQTPHATMRRVTEEEVVLPDGSKLPKGVFFMVDASSRRDMNVYENPESFDGYRFLKMRSQGKENTAQLVSTTPDCLGFGHGEHACPGRFFASNEAKIALCHFLLKYDCKLGPSRAVKNNTQGFTYPSNPSSKVMVRRRATMEIDIDSI